MLGTAYGDLGSRLLPQITGQPGAYGLVGMAAAFVAAGRAPITAVIIIFELTGDYHVILPLMLAVVIATGVAALFGADSIYTLKLRRRGIELRRRRDSAVHGLSVTDAMGAPEPFPGGRESAKSRHASPPLANPSFRSPPATAPTSESSASRTRSWRRPTNNSTASLRILPSAPRRSPRLSHWTPRSVIWWAHGSVYPSCRMPASWSDGSLTPSSSDAFTSEWRTTDRSRPPAARGYRGRPNTVAD